MSSPFHPLSSVCLPINNLVTLIAWSPDDRLIERNTINELSNHEYFDGPKVILCHDMKGGYLEDRFVDGDDNFQAYRFFHWSLINTFIYFSHHFITIPPITWINAAHINGVSILGTLITESQLGREICSSLLESDETIDLVCHKLVDIACYYKLEGWFINIENEITDVQKLLHFIETLRRLMKSAIPRAQVLWYDSVIINGSLEWQNCLNQKNVQFFNLCDGIFLNYNWTDQDLRDSSGFAASLGRLNDVFVGIDVFGRGMIGGGGFNTCIAVNKIREYSLPLAIFAPGWVLECLGPDEFTTNEINFWDKLSLKVRHSPKEIPFYTNFCQGFGLAKFKNGQKVSPNPWYNLSLTQTNTRKFTDGEIHLIDGFEGGQSIRMINWNEPLLKCYFDLETGIEIQLIFKITVEIQMPEMTNINIQVTYQNYGPEDTRLVPTDETDTETLSPMEPPCAIDKFGWSVARFDLKPMQNFVLKSIRLERPTLVEKVTCLVGALKVDHPIDLLTNNTNALRLSVIASNA